LSRGLPEDQAVETAQAAWVRGLEKLHQVRDAQKALTWVNSIALNLYRNQVRKDIKLEALRELPVTVGPNLASIDVNRMLAWCSKNDRALLTYRYLDERDIAEIAEDYGCSQTAVRVRLVRARQRLRDRSARRYAVRSAPAGAPPGADAA
jgi:RNA polymerase sigma factor (sigma-70 family)